VADIIAKIEADAKRGDVHPYKLVSKTPSKSKTQSKFVAEHLPPSTQPIHEATTTRFPPNEIVAVQWRPKSKARYQAVVLDDEDEATPKGGHGKNSTCRVQFDGAWNVAVVNFKQMEPLRVVPPSVLPREFRIGEIVEAQDPFGVDRSWYRATIEDVRQGGIIEEGKVAHVEETVPPTTHFYEPFIIVNLLKLSLTLIMQVLNLKEGWRFWVRYIEAACNQWVGISQLRRPEV